MTDNISRMYKLAEIERRLDCNHYTSGGDWHNDYCYIEKGQDQFKDVCDKGNQREKTSKDRLECPYCEVVDYGYPAFTAEKQIGLIKCITRLKGEFALNFYEYANAWICNTDKKWEMHETYYEHTDFSQALAGLVCVLWKDLNEEQRKEVRGILQ